MTVWTAPGTVHTGTSELRQSHANWYNQPQTEAPTEVVVDNLDQPFPFSGPMAPPVTLAQLAAEYRSRSHAPATADLPSQPPSKGTSAERAAYHDGYVAACNDFLLSKQPTPTRGEEGVSVESSARLGTCKLGLENSLPQTSLRNKPGVTEGASLRFFWKDNTQYWTDLSWLPSPRWFGLSRLSVDEGR